MCTSCSPLTDRYRLCFCGIASGNVVSDFPINDVLLHPSAAYRNDIFYDPICKPANSQRCAAALLPS